MQQRATYVACVGLALLALACGGGGDSEAGGAVSNLSGSYTPAAQNPGTNTVYTTGQAGVGGSAGVVTISVVVKDTTDVFGASFDLDYDPTRAEFVNWSPGDLLEFGGQSVSYQINATTPGRLVVGVARTGSGGVGVTVSGTKTLVKLSLRVRQVGSSGVVFGNPALLDSSNPPAIKSGVSFFGGTLSAV